MWRIYKYPLEVVDRQVIQLPMGAQILDVQMQYDSLQLWALVNPSLEADAVGIRIIGTGHAISITQVQRLNYISTFQMIGGQLVFHVFKEMV